MDQITELAFYYALRDRFAAGDYKRYREIARAIQTGLRYNIRDFTQMYIEHLELALKMDDAGLIDQIAFCAVEFATDESDWNRLKKLALSSSSPGLAYLRYQFRNDGDVPLLEFTSLESQ